MCVTHFAWGLLFIVLHIKKKINKIKIPFSDFVSDICCYKPAGDSFNVVNVVTF